MMHQTNAIATADLWRFSVAPMMDGTDRQCRYFHRLLTRRARLYTEMIVAEAIVRGDRTRLLGFDPVEHPVALQIGGSNPITLAEAARIGEDFGYDEINLNVGCPSDRVQSGAFGACLMKTPALVADCVAAMRAAVSVPVTVKCRIGVDDQDPDETFFGFVDTVTAAGSSVFIVHARKAWLEGLSPKENREIPPLDYEIVRRLKAARPGLTIVLNGGLSSVRQALEEACGVDGVMLGRAAYGEPAILVEVDRLFFGDNRPPPSIDEVVRVMSAYVKRMALAGVKPHHVVRHMLGLHHGCSGARAWRRLLSQHGAAAPVSILDDALAALRTDLSDRGQDSAAR
jgi:tRNA-dihydrouridine synthase A